MYRDFPLDDIRVYVQYSLSYAEVPGISDNRSSAVRLVVCDILTTNCDYPCDVKSCVFIERISASSAAQYATISHLTARLNTRGACPVVVSMSAKRKRK